jgi:hypothetical protein
MSNVIIAAPDPAIHSLNEFLLMDARVKPAHDGQSSIGRLKLQSEV